MADQTEHPFDITEIDHLWIRMPDGVRLAARLWRPVTQRPVPAILEYIPYRKTDMVRARDERNHPFFAAHGYACIRVDMRGSGDSEGHMPDMYAPEELDDARQVIDWLAAQPWCNGRVGMFGTSWGGTASLQASANAPDALKATIAVCATHDRFEDDIHYMGGCVLTDTFEWGATLPSILASPPTQNVGAGWKTLWQERIENLSFPLENWLREDARGAYWRHGSVIHETDALSVPILSVGGWSDRYSNSVMTMVDARPDLVWGVVGPWGHHYPDHGAPGPAIGFQRLALDWWDHWLKPDTPKTPDWPRLRVWLREFDTPGDTLVERQGNWIESGPTIEHVDPQTVSLTSLESSAGHEPWVLPNSRNVGQMSGDTGYFGRAGGLPLDQSDDDARSLVFETAPLSEDLVLYGAADLTLSADVKGYPAVVAARLSDVNANDEVARISYGVRNLALDENLDSRSQPDQPGRVDFSMRLHTTAYRVRKGHRLRLALSSGMWPHLHLHAPPQDIVIQDGALKLPVFNGATMDLSAQLPPPEPLPKKPSHKVVTSNNLVRWNKQIAGSHEVGWHQPMMQVFYPDIGTTFGYETRMSHTTSLDSHEHQRTQVDHRMVFERTDGTADVRVSLLASASRGVTTVHANLTATWNGAPFAARTWTIRHPAKGGIPERDDDS
ncbi:MULTISPECIES: CocE/NonD family hydrolase [unclassified Ruegeria]|uniref:CocE/NonD family hydrolase n=1 Tax=unclassified Ruegeria TaxID=2625375 RepID=UPI00149284FB|nr:MULTISPECIES: CocE/NonD family hydrolase [unclassified Ruegeria]NOD47732.1 CocE/NonD family hydrolase [Ruegeria sp. HKCCD5849]NOD52605.1 CocE/NonD family hydrolase [Ruegeria sp. HKCCD5851]NOD66024.1 CocE/NonD family hydrolase [Ruegeria sp. HKCCD7303]